MIRYQPSILLNDLEDQQKCRISIYSVSLLSLVYNIDESNHTTYCLLFIMPLYIFFSVKYDIWGSKLITHPEDEYDCF